MILSLHYYKSSPSNPPPLRLGRPQQLSRSLRWATPLVSHSILQPGPTNFRLSAFTHTSSQGKVLTDPAHLTGRGKASVVVDDRPSCPLESYMQLPASQYYELDPSLIVPLGGEKFKLKVPRVQLFNVWIEPEADIVVKQQSGSSPKVILEAVDCHLYGSPLIQRWQLDKRFNLHFTTELTWKSGVQANGTVLGNAQGTINADLAIDIFTEVIPPFDLLPRSTLESSCNVVLAALIKSLLPLFMRKLSQDYVKWATNPEYRARRAAVGAGL